MVSESKEVAESIMTDPSTQTNVAKKGINDALDEIGGNISKSDVRDAVRAEVQEGVKETREHDEKLAVNELKYTFTCICTCKCTLTHG